MAIMNTFSSRNMSLLYHRLYVYDCCIAACCKIGAIQVDMLKFGNSVCERVKRKKERVFNFFGCNIIKRREREKESAFSYFRV